MKLSVAAGNNNLYRVCAPVAMPVCVAMPNNDSVTMVDLAQLVSDLCVLSSHSLSQKMVYEARLVHPLYINSYPAFCDEHVDVFIKEGTILRVYGSSLAASVRTMFRFELSDDGREAVEHVFQGGVNFASGVVSPRLFDYNFISSSVVELYGVTPFSRSSGIILSSHPLAGNRARQLTSLESVDELKVDSDPLSSIESLFVDIDRDLYYAGDCDGE